MTQQPQCENHSAIEARLKNVERQQESLRAPDGNLNQLWSENKQKVTYKLFFWIIGGMFSFMIMMQTMIYREIDNMANKVERLSENVIQLRGK